MLTEPRRQSVPRLIAWLGAPWLDMAMVVFGVWAAFATTLLTYRSVADDDGPASYLAASGVALAFLLLARCVGRRGAQWVPPFVRFASQPSIGVIVAAALLLRLIWVMTVNASPASDGAVYLQLARQLADGEEYFTNGTYAYWPAGYPLFLVPWVWLFDGSRWIWVVPNLLLSMVGVYGVWRLVLSVADESAARIAAVLFALWPNLIVMTATPDKENVVVALLAWAVWSVLAAIRGSGGVRHAGLAGALLGACTLVQPSVQLLLPLLVGLLGLTLGPARALIASAAFVLGAALIVAPWTIRNYEQFGRFVLVSSNGGDNLYRANNPLAHGGWTPSGEVVLDQPDELERDAAYKALALHWIRAHPGDFLRLTFEKQARFMGDDAAGVYSALKVGKGTDSGSLYFLVKSAANLWWLLSWLLLVGALLSRRRNERSEVSPWARLPFWLWIYFFVLHSVFESTGKYHVPVLWVLPAMLGVALSARAMHRSP